MKQISDSELILNNNGSIYHLHLNPQDIASTIILVGDPGRVNMVSKFFDKIFFKIQNREFLTHTGEYNNKTITVLSTGIGTDNIDIVINELDALVNIDFKTKTIKEKLKSLSFIRIGTSGGLQKEAKVGSFIVSRMAIGFDNLLNFYAQRSSVCEINAEKKFLNHIKWNESLGKPYIVKCSDTLFDKFKNIARPGITISAPGFYAPQARQLRLNSFNPEINEQIQSFSYNKLKIMNYEMESSAIFGLSKLLNHNAITLCTIIANRVTKTVCKNYKKSVEKLIELILNKITE